MAYKLQAIEKEVEKYTEEDYDDVLRDIHGITVSIAGMEFDTVYALETLDPTAYRCGFNEYQEYTTVYVCPICGDEHEEEEDALDCCAENYIDDEEDDSDEE